MTVLAEKLAERKDLVTRIGRIDDEIGGVLFYDKEDSEDQTKINKIEAEGAVATLVDELGDKLDQLQDVENTIREANTKTVIVGLDGDEITISAAIVLRDRLKTEYNAWDSIAKAVEGTSERSRRSYGYERRKKDDIQEVPVKTARELRDVADGIARKLRLLDTEIQKANWSTEV